jgi:PTS system glucitol/sorbitol-specific IIA component
MKYESTITAIGNLARNFLENNNSVILLNDGLRPNLSDMVIEHTAGDLLQDIAVGDTLLIADAAFSIIAVGEDVNKNIRQEGHCTLVFNTSGTMPGQIILQGDYIPRLNVGDKITIE